MRIISKRIRNGCKYLGLFILTMLLLTQSAIPAAEADSSTLLRTVTASPKRIMKLGLNGTVKIAENPNLVMFLDSKYMNITIRDKKTGKTWDTNPFVSGGSGTTSGENADLLKSQFSIKYYDMHGNVNSMTSYRDAVVRNQVQAYAVDGGVEVSYSLGDHTRGVNDVPAKMSDSRFQKLILSKLGGEDKRKIQRYYRYYDSEKTWILSNHGKSNINDVLAIFDKVGYTADDLVTDNEEYGVSGSSTKKPIFSVSLCYALTDDGVRVTIPSDKLSYTKSFPVNQIDLLENFASSPSPSGGYLFVPDGCGALINFEKADITGDTFVTPVFGSDGTIKSQNSNVNVSTAALPVFGLKDGENAIFAIIESGQADASVNAYRAGKKNNNNAVYASFKIANMDYVSLGGTDDATSVPVFQSRIYQGGYAVRYAFLSGDSASYSGMAAYYRNYLMKTEGLKKLNNTGNMPFYLETIGGVYSYKNFLGFSYVGLKAATTYADDIRILQALQSAGINNVKLKLTGWFNGGVSHKYASRISLNGVLGGTAGFRTLLRYARDNHVDVFPDVDLLTVGKAGNGFMAVFDCAKTLDFNEAKVNDLDLVKGTKQEDDGLALPYRYILSPEKSYGITTKFLKDYAKYSVGGGIPANDRQRTIFGLQP